MARGNATGVEQWDPDRNIAVLTDHTTSFPVLYSIDDIFQQQFARETIWFSGNWHHL